MYRSFPRGEVDLVKLLKHEDFVCQIGFSRLGKVLKHEDSCLESSAVDDAAPVGKFCEALKS